MKPVALVTGASRGIGRAIALELSSTHQVLATYRGRKDAAESLRAETGAEIFACDIGSSEDRLTLLAFAKSHFGQIDLPARTVRAIAEGSLDYSPGQVINVDGGFHLRTL